jgi:predicted amidohydrolase YtcJ
LRLYDSSPISCVFLLRLISAFLLVCCSALGTAKPEKADLVITNARVYTVNSNQPWAEAIAVQAGKILAVGNNGTVQKLIGPNTRVIDAQQHLVLPAFTDCHVHFMDGALSLQRVNVEDAKNIEEIQQQVKQFADAHPNDPWVLGRGWNYAQFPTGLPDKKYLDAVVPDRPVFLDGYDGHTSWANSKALAAAQINRKTPDPPNGVIVRDEHGDPTGALKESAYDLVEKVLPKPTREQRLAALRNAIKEANRLGLSRVHSAGQDFEYLDLYDEIRRSGDLTLRFYIAYFLDPPSLTPDAINKIETARKQFADDWIAGGAVKTMLDGVVESHTAAMLTPYGDQPTTSGKLFWDPQKYQAAIIELDRRGLQIFTHAIGDRAVRLALDSYANAKTANNSTDPRHRIEHIETQAADDIPRFGREGVIASMQPLHAYPDDDTLKAWAPAAGPDRASRGWPWQSIAQTHGILAFGSDWPVVTLNPWYGVQNAVTRETADRTPPGGWLPNQRLSLEQTIRAYTLGAAYAGHRERTEGSIETSKLADIIILDQDLFKTDPHNFRATKVLVTIVGGKVVYQSPDWNASKTSEPGK